MTIPNLGAPQLTPIGNGFYEDRQGNVFRWNGWKFEPYSALNPAGGAGTLMDTSYARGQSYYPTAPVTAPAAPRGYAGEGAAGGVYLPSNAARYIPNETQLALGYGDIGRLARSNGGTYSGTAGPSKTQLLLGYGDIGRTARSNGGTYNGPAPGAGAVTPVDPLKPYKDLASYYGVDWDVLHRVYLNGAANATGTDIKKAIATAWEDGQWARIATKYLGHVPNELEWKEHWYWKMSGGKARDPVLEPGHNQAMAEWNTIELPPPPGFKPEPQVSLTGTPVPSMTLTPEPKPQAPQAQSPYLPGQAALDQLQVNALGF